MREALFEKIKDFDLQTLQEKFIELYIRYYNLNNNIDTDDIKINDQVITAMFKKLKESNLDKAKKANLRKIILELEATQNITLYKYISMYI